MITIAHPEHSLHYNDVQGHFLRPPHGSLCKTFGRGTGPFSAPVRGPIDEAYTKHQRPGPFNYRQEDF